MSRELPKDRLATTDEAGKRVYLYPAAVKGKYHSRKRWVHPLLLLIFLLLPWVYVGGKQLLLFDVARREFFFFGLHFRAHDAPFVLFLLLGFTFLIGLITTIWGRLWCGWACPQTVFTEALFRRIETWIEGNHRDRKALDQGEWTQAKILKKSAKWAAFTFISLVITHSFLAYFVGSRELIGMISSSPTDNWASFLVILFATGLILFDFGWFREQFCVIMCPYGRFQSVMLDSHSTVVGYDTKRGEPRRQAQTPSAPHGDCVDCFRCVQVCPTGIDIRRGLQMECISCTACIDACDEVMTKTKRPVGLIRYTTLAELSGRRRRRFTVRAGVYAILLAIVLGTMTVLLSGKEFLEATVLRATGSPYEIVPSPAGPLVVNHFRLDLSNQTGGEKKIEISLKETAPGIELVMPMNPLTLEDGSARKADFFLRFPPGVLQNGSKKIQLELRYPGNERQLEVPLVGPNA